MGKILDILALPEPERTKAIEELDQNDVYPVYSPVTFKFKVGKIPAQGDFAVGTEKYVTVKKGKNTFPLHVALKILYQLGPYGAERYGKLVNEKAQRTAYPQGLISDEPLEKEEKSEKDKKSDD